MMRFYKNPLEAYRISHEDYKKLDQKVKDRMWARYLTHIDARGFRGLIQKYLAFSAETHTIKYNYPNSVTNI